MDFISGSFLLFFIITIFVYYSIPGKGQWIWLLLAGMFFYLYASPKLSVFILFSSLSSYVWAKYCKQSSLLYWCVILLNTGLLFGLKTASSGSILASYLRIDRFAWLLPLGISFYTLQIIAYMTDVKKEKIDAENNFFKYLLFITYFPQILQGPIPRYSQLSGQLTVRHRLDVSMFVGGFELMLWGYFQKLVVADRANIMVNRLFGEYQSYHGMYMILAGVLYSIQLYADFNGCVCIAKGVSEMLGIRLADNFTHPYFSDSIKEFWRRWHISLSSWLRDYIYIPLGGNRNGRVRKYINLFITFFVSGIWHGIGSTFIIWGLLHAFYQMMGEILTPLRNRFVSLFHINRNTFSHRLWKQVTTFVLVMIAWMFFRASSVSQAIAMIKSMVTTFNPWILWDHSIYLLGLDAKNVWILMIGILTMFFVSYLQTKMSLRAELTKQGIIFRYLIIYIAIFAVLIFGIYGPGYDAAQFIYGGF